MSRTSSSFARTTEPHMLRLDTHLILFLPFYFLFFIFLLYDVLFHCFLFFFSFSFAFVQLQPQDFAHS